MADIPITISLETLVGDSGAKIAGIVKLMAELFAQIREVAKEGDSAEDAFRNLAISIEEARKATGGEVEALELARKANAALMGGLALTSEQYARIAEFAKLAGDATGQDFGSVMDRVLQAMITGRAQSLRPFIGDLELTGTTAEKQAQVLEALTNKINDYSGGARNAGDASSAFETSMAELTTEFSRGFAESEGLTRAIDDLSAAMEHASGGSISAGTAVGELIAVFVRLNFVASAATAVLNGYAVVANAIRTGDWSDEAAARIWAGRGTTVQGAGGNDAARRRVQENALEARLFGDRTLMGGQTLSATERELGRPRSGSGGAGGGGGVAELGASATELFNRARALEAASIAYDKALDDAEKVLKRDADSDKLRRLSAMEAEGFQDSRSRLETSEDARVRKDKFYSDQAIANMERERRTRQALTAQVQAYTDAVLQSGMAAALQGKDAEGVVRAVLAALSMRAGTEALMETAAGLAALGVTWGVPNPSAAAHFSAAAVYGAIALGAVGVGKAAFGGSFGHASNGMSAGAGGGSGGTPMGASGFGGGGGSGSGKTYNITINATHADERSLRRWLSAALVAEADDGRPLPYRAIERRR